MTASSAPRQHPRHRDSILSTTTASSAPRQHPWPARAALMLPLPRLPVPSSGWGMQGTAPRFPSHTPPALYFIYSLYCKTPGFSEQTAATLRQRRDRTQAPSFPAMAAHPRATGVGGSAHSPRQPLPPPRTVLLQRARPSSPAGWDGCGMPGATGYRLSSRERCHGCSIPPGCSAAGQTRSQRPAPMHNGAGEHDWQENGFPVAFRSPLRRGCRGRALPALAPPRKRGDGGILPPGAGGGGLGSSHPALGAEEAQPPSPIPGWRRRVTGLVNL